MKPIASPTPTPTPTRRAGQQGERRKTRTRTSRSRSRSRIAIVLWSFSLVSAEAIAADIPAAAATAPVQAAVHNPVKEADLTTVTLTPEAAKRLGITAGPIEKKPVPHERLYGGEVILPLAVGEGSEALIDLAPPQTPAEFLKLAELQVTADGEVSQAKVKLEAAKLALDRASKLVASQTASERALEEARAAHELAKAADNQATSKRALLGRGLASSLDGRRWWVRTRILAADATTLDPQAAARVTRPGSATFITAGRITSAPASANPLAATVDWYFEIDDPERQRRPGERVEVRIPLAGAGEPRLTLPWSAVLHDIHGGQWVYEMTGPTTFVRRRVQVARVVGSSAVLATGPPIGAKIVTDGAAELFGVEFGPGR
jgi:hypothetical protein